MIKDLVKELPSPNRGRWIWRPSIGQKIGGIFLLVLLVAAANIVVVKKMQRDLNGVAATLNVAGKLRMLSQKIALETVSQALGKSGGHDTIESGIHDFERALAALEHGGAVFGYDIQKLPSQHYSHVRAVQRNWIDYREHIRAVLAPLAMGIVVAPGVTQLESVTAVTSSLLARTEMLISSIVTQTQQTQDQALARIYALVLLDVLMLAMAFVAIRRQVVHPLSELSRYCRDLAAGNYSVRSSFQSFDEIGQLANVFNDAAQRIGDLVTHIEQDRQSLRQAEAMFRELAENSVVGVYIVQDDAFRFVNAKMADMFDYEPIEMMASVGVLDIVAENQRQLVKEGIRKRLSGEIQEVHYERQARKKDGSLIDIEVFGSRMRIDGRDATIGIMLDISKRKKAEMSEHLMTLVYQYSSEGMVISDVNGVIVTVNPAFTEITGYLPDEVIGNKLNILSSGRHDQAFYQTMWRAINTAGHWRGEVWNRRKSGEVYVELLTINTAYNEDGTVFRRIGVFSDITERKQSEAVVWQQANFDFLTRLPNRHMFHDRLQQEITKSHRAGLPLALLFLDLDQFKEVNDTLGHDIGDRLLKQAAQRLSSCVRESDTVARLGGDEFTIILSELKDVNVVKRIGQNILEKLAQPFMLEGEEVFISASIGITLYPDDATEIEDLIKNADQAMYAAKDHGRNQLHYFARSMQEAAQSRRWLQRDLRGALADNQFHLHYQPIVNLANGSIDKAEALIRWQHPVRGLISPAEFIPIAEDTGMIIEIGDWVFRQAAQQVALWRSTHCAHFQISVNTSAVQFRRGGIVHDEWLGHLRGLGLPGNSIAIEITERLLMDAGVGVTDKLRILRAAGIQAALDDFGTGYSSMSYLKKFDIDYLKIDQSFVRNLAPASDDMALCEAIIVMAHKLGMKVIAEGIETEQHRDLLAAAGCDFGQGYLFSRPVAAEEFQAFLQPDCRMLSYQS